MALAPRCAVCAMMLDAPLDGPICPVCWSTARAQVLPSLSLPDDRAIDIGRAAAPYEGAIRDIIHAFKYEGRRSLARPLGAMMRDAARDLCEGAACVVPVPLHGWRRLRRGFNQAADLAAQLDMPVVHALWRSRPTTRQMELTAAERLRNVRRAFQAAPWLQRRTRDRYLTGHVVVLVDDVSTTGATLHACAVALRDAGAGEVRALAVAATRKRVQPTQ